MNHIRALVAGIGSREERQLSSVSFISFVGYGMYAPGIILFLVKTEGVSPVHAGLAQTVATVCALLVSVPAGRLMDLLGPRRLAMLSSGAQALLLLAMSVAGSAAAVAFLVLQSVAARAMYVALGSVVAQVCPPERRTQVSAILQTANNLGFMIGAVLFSTIVAVGAPASPIWCVIGYAVAQGLCAILLTRITTDDTAQEDHAEPKRLFSMTAIKDVPYVATALFCGLLMISDDILIIGIPLWIASHPDIPAIFSTSLAALSTGIIVLLQIRFSKAVRSRWAAVRRFRLSGLLLAAACLLIGATSLPIGSVAAPLTLIIAVVVLSVGEMLYNPAKWFLRYNMAREHAQGEYGGVFSFASGVGAALGPALIAGLLAGIDPWAWPVLAVGFVAVGLLASLPSRFTVPHHSYQSP